MKMSVLSKLGMAFVAGLAGIVPLCFGAYDGAGTFTNITSRDDLTPGYYVIVNSGDSFAMTRTNGGSYFTHAAVSPSSGTLVNPGVDIVWDIQTNATYGGLTIYSEAATKYVTYAGSANASYASDAVEGTTGVWTFTYASDVFTAANVGTPTRILQYNSGAPRFACYTSAQQKLRLYKMMAPPTDPTIILSAGELAAFATTYGVASAAQSFTVRGTNLTADLTVTAPSGFEVSELEGSGYGATVTLTPASGGVDETTVYVRLTGAALGTPSGNVEATSTDADAQAKAVSGAVTLAATATSAASGVSFNQFTANWSGVSGATGYRLDVSTTDLTGAGDSIETIFRETMGSVGGTTTLAAHESADGFDNDGYTMSDGEAANPGDIRTTSVSSGYTDPAGNAASGVANVYFTSTVGEYGFEIGGIDASGYSYQLLSFGYRKESASANAALAIDWSTNSGVSWSSVSVSNLPAAGEGAGWYMVSNLYLPPEASSVGLSIRWVKSGSVAMRLDDVLLQGMPPAPTYVPGFENRDVGNVTSASVTGLVAGTTYYYRVRATAGAETSPNSDVREATASDAIVFYARVPTSADHDPDDPSIWGPNPGPGWTGNTMSSNAGWWSVTVAVADASAEITYQLRFAQSGSVKYQKATGNFAADPTFTTTTGEIWIDASADASFTWSFDNFYLAAEKITEGNSTRVVLYGMSAGEENGQVVVRWETASEEGTVGFWVERWDGAAWVRVNDAIVYAKGTDGMGASYAVADPGAQLAAIHAYRLVEEESDGGVQTYGPYDLSTSFAFRSPVAFGAAGATIRWLSRAGEAYRIERSRSLVQGFETLATGIAATPPENDYLDASAGAFGVYRIRVEP
jgi:hypothetical protein